MERNRLLHRCGRGKCSRLDLGNSRLHKADAFCQFGLRQISQFACLPYSIWIHWRSSFVDHGCFQAEL